MRFQGKNAVQWCERIFNYPALRIDKKAALADLSARRMADKF